MDLAKLHNVLMTAAAHGGQHVAPEWLDYERFAADVSPALDAIAKEANLRLYRRDNAKPWSRANCYLARPSGPHWPLDPALAVQESARLEFLRREAKRQNAYEMQEAA